MNQPKITAMLIAAAVLWSSPVHAGKPKALASMIRCLGSQTEIEDLEELRPHKHRAIQLLVRELHSIPLEEVMDQDPTFEKELHIIWSIQALELLTGKEFKAPTSITIEKKPFEYREMFVMDQGQCKFYGFWPTHLTYYIAPIDAQEAIIKQWLAFARAKNPSSP